MALNGHDAMSEFYPLSGVRRTLENPGTFAIFATMRRASIFAKCVDIIPDFFDTCLLAMRRLGPYVPYRLVEYLPGRVDHVARQASCQAKSSEQGRTGLGGRRFVVDVGKRS